MTDDDLDERLRAVILAEDVDTSRLAAAVRNQIHSRRSRGFLWVLAAAASMALAIAVSFAYQAFFVPPPVCVAAVQDHEREIVNGARRRWLSDLSAIQSLAAKQGVPASAIAQLGTTGYRLERGRLCFLKKQIYLHLVYSRDGALNTQCTCGLLPTKRLVPAIPIRLKFLSARKTRLTLKQTS